MTIRSIFNLVYSIFHVVAGLLLFVFEIVVVVTTGESTNVVGAVGIFMAISGVLGIRRNRRGWQAQIFVILVATLFAAAHLAGLTILPKDQTSDIRAQLSVSVLIIIWAFAEWAYLVCRIREARMKSEEKEALAQSDKSL